MSRRHQGGGSVARDIGSDRHATSGGSISWELAIEAAMRRAIERVVLVAAAIVAVACGAFCGAPLAASATASLAYSEITGGEPPEQEAIIVWWTPNGAATVSFDTAIVRIR